MHRAKYHNPKGCVFFQIAVALADQSIEFLQRFASCHHVHNVHTHLHNELLWHHNPESQLWAKSLLTKFMIPIKPLARHHLMHFHHLPKCIECDNPRKHQNNHSRTPARCASCMQPTNPLCQTLWICVIPNGHEICT